MNLKVITKIIDRTIKQSQEYSYYNMNQNQIRINIDLNMVVFLEGLQIKTSKNMKIKRISSKQMKLELHKI